MFENYAGTWYLSIVPVAVAVLLSFIANNKLSQTVRDLGGHVRTRADLPAVKAAINLNKSLAMVYILVWLGQIAACVLAATKGLVTIRGAIGHVFVFGILTLPFGLWSKSVEARFKNMKVDPADPYVGHTWQRWLVDWKKAGFSIKD